MFGAFCRFAPVAMTMEQRLNRRVYVSHTERGLLWMWAAAAAAGGGETVNRNVEVIDRGHYATVCLWQEICRKRS